MSQGKRGQITYEYLVIVGMVILLVIPLFDYSFFTLGENIGVVNGVAQTVQLATSLEEISYLGEGSATTVSMDDVKSITVSPEGYVTSTLKNDKELTIPSTTRLSGMFVLQPGIVSVVYTADGLAILNAPQINDVIPNNFYGVDKAAISGNNLAKDGIIIIVGTEDITQNKVSYQYAFDQYQAQSETLKSFTIDPHPNSGVYTVTVKQYGLSSNEFPVIDHVEQQPK